MSMGQGKRSVVLYALLPGPVQVPLWNTLSSVVQQAFLHLGGGHYLAASTLVDQLVDIPPVTVFVFPTSPFAHERVFIHEIWGTSKSWHKVHRVLHNSAAFLETLGMGVFGAESSRVATQLGQPVVVLAAAPSTTAATASRRRRRPLSAVVCGHAVWLTITVSLSGGAAGPLRRRWSWGGPQVFSLLRA